MRWQTEKIPSLPLPRIAENILNKQSRTADRGWFFSLRVVIGLIIRHRKKRACHEMIHGTSTLNNSGLLMSFSLVFTLHPVHRRNCLVRSLRFNALTVLDTLYRSVTSLK